LAKKTKSVLKNARQSEKRRLINRTRKSKVKKLLKTLKNIKEKDKLNEQIPNLQSVVDKAVKRSIIHKNTAGRIKSKLMVK
jgi:small subunit ribosomal protein S20